eukprot:TRINITY_DN19797_c0_g1_i1.p1 TRINITY_DN19797_c0_g1~~TRINITY_DN19797_c0_g1_i1.p1  ORF type:complete len:986 (+),score=285.91 TRINITY_DN19797_c0_g1_i1:74-2959(+)
MRPATQGAAMIPVIKMREESPADDIYLQGLIRSEKVGSLKVRLSRDLNPNRVMRERSALHKGGEGSVSLLQLAAYSESRAAVRALLDTPGCDPNLWQGTSYPTPLQCACMYKRLSRDGGADAAAEMAAHEPEELGEGARRSFGSVPIAELLLRRGAAANEAAQSGVNALALAVMNNNAPLCVLLLRHAADPCACARLNLHNIACNRGVVIWNLLCGDAVVAADGSGQRADALRGIARHSLIDPTTPEAAAGQLGGRGGEFGTTMLHAVCDATLLRPSFVLPSPCGTPVPQLAVALAAELLRLGAQCGARDMRGRTPLHLAWATAACPQLCCTLLEHGADPRVRDFAGLRPFESHPSGRSALHITLSGETKQTPQERRAWCDLLLDTRSCNVSGQAPQCKSTPLHILCRHPKRTADAYEVAARMLQVGADPNALDAAQETPLYIACLVARSPKLVAALLANGADPDVPCRNQRTALQALARSELFEGVGPIAALLAQHSRLAPHETPLSPSNAAGPRLIDHPAVSSPLWYPFMLRAAKQEEACGAAEGSSAARAKYYRTYPRRGGAAAAKARRAAERDHFCAYLRGEAGACALPQFAAVEREDDTEGDRAQGGSQRRSTSGADTSAAVQAAERATARRRWLEVDAVLAAELSAADPPDPRAEQPDTELAASPGRQSPRAARPPVPAAADGATVDAGFARGARPPAAAPRAGMPSREEWLREMGDWRRASWEAALGASGASQSAADSGSSRASPAVSRPATASASPSRPPTHPAGGSSPAALACEAAAVRPSAAPIAAWVPVTARSSVGTGDDVVTRLLRRREQDRRGASRATTRAERRQESHAERRTVSELLVAQRQLMRDLNKHATIVEAAQLQNDLRRQEERRRARKVDMCHRRLDALTATEAAEIGGGPDKPTWEDPGAAATVRPWSAPAPGKGSPAAVPPRRAPVLCPVPPRLSPTRA